MAQPPEGQVRLVKIDLDELYGYGVKLASEDFLKLILDQYEAIEYKLLFSASPDIDVIYHDSSFKDYATEYPDDDADLVEIAMKYAEKNGYEAVVWLFDGYEEAVAIVRPRDGDE